MTCSFTPAPVETLPKAQSTMLSEPSSKGEKPGLRATAYMAAAGSIAFALLAVVSAASVVATPTTPIFAALAMGCFLSSMVAWYSKDPQTAAQDSMQGPGFIPQSLVGNYGIDANQLNIENGRGHDYAPN